MTQGVLLITIVGIAFLVAASLITMAMTTLAQIRKERATEMPSQRDFTRQLFR